MILKEITANKRVPENIHYPPPPLPKEGNVNSEGRRGVQKVAISEGVAFIWEMKEGKYTMTLSKIQVCANFHMRYIIRRNVLANTEFWMVTPC